MQDTYPEDSTQTLIGNSSAVNPYVGSSLTIQTSSRLQLATNILMYYLNAPGAPSFKWPGHFSPKIRLVDNFSTFRFAMHQWCSIRSLTVWYLNSPHFLSYSKTPNQTQKHGLSYSSEATPITRLTTYRSVPNFKSIIYIVLLWVGTTSQMQLYFITHSLLVIIALLVSIWINHDCQITNFTNYVRFDGGLTCGLLWNKADPIHESFLPVTSVFIQHNDSLVWFTINNITLPVLSIILIEHRIVYRKIVLYD